MLNQSSLHKREYSMPAPTYMSKRQMGEYLHDLRTNRVPRPNGSRPLPESCSRGDAVSVRSNEDGTPLLTFNSSTMQNSSVNSKTANIPPNLDKQGRPWNRRSEISDAGDSIYVERKERLIEKREAHAIRMALQDTNSEDHLAIMESAQKQAEELIRRHQSPNEPYALEEIATELNAYLSDTCVNLHNSAYKPGQMKTNPGSRSSSSGSSSSNYSDVVTTKLHRQDTKPSDRKSSRSSSERRISTGLFGSSLVNLKNRRRSSGSTRKTSQPSHHGIFSNPEDKIYEDPEESVKTDLIATKVQAQPTSARLNPFMRRRTSRQSLPAFPLKSSASTASDMDDSKIKTNPDLDLTKNIKLIPEVREPLMATPNEDNDSEEIRYKQGIEIRSDELRAATSMKFKDRSPRLPSPVVVTDSPGRPIVSFRSDWKPKPEESNQTSYNFSESRREPSKSGHMEVYSGTDIQRGHRDDSVVLTHNPYLSNTPKETEKTIQRFNAISATKEPSIPQIFVDETPMISIEENTDVIRPSKTERSHQPIEKCNDLAQPRVSGTWDNPPSLGPSGIRRQMALCAQCALPISGRIVTAAGTRFHPECFNCCHCGEGLECVAFYPEPEGKREERLERINRRINGEETENDSTINPDDDGDESLRFYCHLDFHEFFSPRCKNCKTPVEGEIIQACGAEWHVGHFFCAQCGDPFDSNTPFVEKDGYAWCVNCHTNRYSAKCKKCRKPVTGMVVNAMGAEWHDECFCCMECNGGFEDGQYFVHDGNPGAVCIRCEEKRLKAW